LLPDKSFTINRIETGWDKLFHPSQEHQVRLQEGKQVQRPINCLHSVAGQEVIVSCHCLVALRARPGLCISLSGHFLLSRCGHDRMQTFPTSGLLAR
jgi:hypothetical protein